MPNWTKPAKKEQEIAILLLPRFSNLCLANAVEPLRAANELLPRPFYRWSFVTLDGAPVTSSSGLPVLPSGKLQNHPGADGLFVMASYDARLAATAETRRTLIAADRRFGSIVGMDTGAWLLAHAGLLDNKAATIHPNEQVAFAERFEAVNVVTDRYVTENRHMTCGGAMSTFDLMLELLRRTHGEALKLELSHYFLDQPTHQGVHLLKRQSRSPTVANCIAEMGRHLEKPLQLSDLATASNMSHRNLTRLFTKELGAAPAAVYRRLRLNAARDYVSHSHLAISEISVRCGYQDASAMTRAFVKEFGRTPSSFRKRHTATPVLKEHSCAKRAI